MGLLFFHCVLLLLTSIQVEYLAESRPFVKFLEVPKGGEEEMRMEGAMIGSRPPRCEGRCSSCGHCEAIQVPLAPQHKDAAVLHGSRFDDSSNYKPMSWKCKCGGMILNP